MLENALFVGTESSRLARKLVKQMEIQIVLLVVNLAKTVILSLLENVRSAAMESYKQE